MFTQTQSAPRIISVGQRVHCGLYYFGPGIVYRIHGEQSPESIRTYGGVMTSGGTATFDIVFLNGAMTAKTPESILRGVQWEISGEIASAAEIQDALEHAAAVAEDRKISEAATAKRRADERDAHKRDNPHLAQPGTLHGAKLAAENIRRELKRQFPDHKFSVRSDHNSVDIRWTDGPTTRQVSEFTDRHKNGHFDGMTDCYEQNHDATFADVFGGANYVSCHRDITPAGYRLAWVMHGGKAEEIPADVKTKGWGNAHQISDRIWDVIAKVDLRPDAYAAELLNRFPPASVVGPHEAAFAHEAIRWENVGRINGRWYLTSQVMHSIKFFAGQGYRLKLTGQRETQPNGAVFTFFTVLPTD